MSDIAEFILARVAEDEAVASITGDGSDRWEQWHTVGCGYDMYEWPTNDCVCGYPARVLAECAAKRAIVAANQPGYRPRPGVALTGGRSGEYPEFTQYSDDSGVYLPRMQDRATWDKFMEPAPPNGTLLALARIWADHPEFDAAWAEV